MHSACPNADKINWTLIQSSSSDSASTQKKLVEEKREEDNERYGPVGECPDVEELVQTFCCMQLGVNLRKAFFAIPKNQVVTMLQVTCWFTSFVNYWAGCKHGAVAFADFLSLMTSQSVLSEASYYQRCLSVKLERQVGSRYFVTAANSGSFEKLPLVF